MVARIQQREFIMKIGVKDRMISYMLKHGVEMSRDEYESLKLREKPPDGYYWWCTPFGAEPGNVKVKLLRLRKSI